MPPNLQDRLVVTVLLLATACGGSNADSTFTPTTPTIAPPSVPQSVVATIGSGTVRLAFAAPASDGGAAISLYTAVCSASGTAALSATGTASPITVSGLTNGVAYACTIAASNSKGIGSASLPVSVTSVAPPAVGAFRGSVVLGSPTNSSIKANVYAADQSGSVYISYGTSAGLYDAQTPSVALSARTPIEIALSGLQPNTQYYYRPTSRPRARAPVRPTRRRFARRVQRAARSRSWCRATRIRSGCASSLIRPFT